MKTSKLSVKLPTTKEKKPFLTSGSPACVGGFYTDGNYNKIKMSPIGVLKIAKNWLLFLNKSNNYIYLYSIWVYYT